MRDDARSAGTAAKNQIGMKNKKILIVDNEPDINLSLKIFLEENGFKVDAFDDPIIALDNFRKGTYDLLILDKNA
jgi:DNA-binding response OmpR family regulator